MILTYSAEAQHTIRNLPPEIKQGMRKILEEVAINPYLGKPLQREFLGFWSFAFKRYRIIYKILNHRQTILIYAVGHRSTIYDELSSVLIKNKSVQ